MKIEPEQFELYAAIIRSGQMEHSEVPKFMEENPEFAEWYKEKLRPK